ncbi:MAG TPA: Hsp20/alpha crystallin family protein [Thermoanaerobaculia bacterium]|nr:Hsp20/alpha crystallin family protein [Thermoanaerobaculia bacterium]
MKEKVPVKYERPNPLVMFDDLRAEFENFFDRPWGFKFRPEKVGWAPKIDVFEKDNMLFVKADLPGMKKEEVHVTLEENDLILKGERKEEKEVKEEDFYRAERMYGSFYRRLPLNFTADPAKIEAKFVDGVLEVKLPVPKVEEPKGLPIPIN